MRKGRRLLQDVLTLTSHTTDRKTALNTPTTRRHDQPTLTRSSSGSPAVNTHARVGAAPSNFTATLPPADSDLAQAMVHDPYLLDFLDLAGPVAERDLEAALMDKLQAFLLELGHGFAFVGHQYRLEVDGDEFHIDLLFFNWLQSRFVVVELRVSRFAPEHVGQLGFYVAWVDDNLRIPGRHEATVGILLCAGQNERVVRYSLAGASAPLAVAGYTYDALPTKVRELVPTDDELTGALGPTPPKPYTIHHPGVEPGSGRGVGTPHRYRGPGRGSPPSRSPPRKDALAPPAAGWRAPPR